MCIKGIRKRYAEITISPNILKGSVNMKENKFKKVKNMSCSPIASIRDLCILHIHDL